MRRILLPVLSVVLLCVFACCGFGVQEDLPDLLLPGLSTDVAACAVLEPETASKGQVVVVQTRIANGGEAVSGAFTVECSWRRVDAQEVCGHQERTVGELTQGSTPIDLTFLVDTADLIPGAYEVKIQLDSRYEIAETDETNNGCLLRFEVRAPKPDLHPSQIRLVPSSPVALGESVRVSVLAHNTGDAAAGRFVARLSVFPVAYTATLEPDVPCGDGNHETSPAAITLADVPADAWIPYASIEVPGIGRDADETLSFVLDTVELWDLLVTNGPPDLYECLFHDVVLALRVVLEEPEGVSEFDVDNNEILGVLTVGGSELAKPELRPRQIRLNRDMPIDWGRDVRVFVQVENVGGRGTTLPVVVELELAKGSGARTNGENVLVTLSKTLASLPIEEGSSIQEVYFDLVHGAHFPSPGEYSVTVRVQYDGDELNPNNNEMSLGFSVQGSELHPLSVELAGAPVRQGDTITVSSEIENTGELAVASFTVAFFINDLRFDTYHYNAPSGTGLTENHSVKARGVLDTTDLPFETYRLRVVVDPEDRLPELDEGNNEISVPLEIQAPEQRKAELHPTDLSLSPATALQLGDPLLASVAIWNTGDIDADHFLTEFAVRYRSDESVDWGPFPESCGPATGYEADPAGWFCGQVEALELARGARWTASHVFDTTDWDAGYYQLRVCVDPAGETSPDGEVAEQDEQNNEMIVSFRIGAPKGSVPPTEDPNLVFERLTVTPQVGVSVGQQLEVAGTIRNTGRVAAGPFLIALWWDGSAPAAAPIEVPGLAVGASHEFTTSIVGPPAPGANSLVGLADSDRRIQEQSEDDNEARATVEATGDIKPDLRVSRIRFSEPIPVLPGTPVTVYVTVENGGMLPSGPFQVGFQQDGSAQFGISQSVELQPNRSIELPFALQTTLPGTYTLIFVVDVGEAVDETSELNNVVDDVTFVVADQLEPVEVSQLTNLAGAARFLEVDPSTGILYASTVGGRVTAFDRGVSPSLRFDVELPGAGSITAQALVSGVALYLGTEAGAVVLLDPLTGAEDDEIKLPSIDGAVRCLAVAGAGTIYVGTDAGILAVDPRHPSVDRASGVAGPVTDVWIDELTGFVYAMGPEGVTVLDPSLDPLCRVDDLGAAPTALAVGSQRLYVGTADGAVHAYAKCAGLMNAAMEELWSTSIGTGAVTSVVVDLRGTDPIYATSAVGELVALEVDGTIVWSFQAGAGILSGPAVDRASRRLYFADASGVPYVLAGDGTPAFPVVGDVSAGSSVRSTFSIDTFDAEVNGIIRHLRAFYYGGEDGGVYVLQTDR